MPHGIGYSGRSGGPGYRKNSFNGTWGTDATWHRIFYKDIKAHELFSGTFEAEKLIKFHENPVPEKDNQPPCDGIDC